MSHTTPNQGPGHAGSDELARIRRRLRTIASRVRAVLVVRSVLASLALLTALALGLGLSDYLLRLPMGVRVLLWLGLAGLAVRCWVRSIAPALGARASETDIALTIEDREPALRGLLASAVDLDRAPMRGSEDDAGIGRSLTTAALGTAHRRLAGLTPGGVLRLGALGKSAGWLAVVAVLVVALGVRWPTLASVGARRVLTPWASVSWPKRYAITDVTSPDPRPIDVAVPVRALIGPPGSGTEGGARALVRWRLLDSRRRALGDWSPALLVPQRRRDAQSGIPVYEQLIDALGAAGRADDTAFTLEYRIETRDDTSATRRITLVRPPELRSTTVSIELPPYAAPIADGSLVRSGEIVSQSEDLSITPVLAGSRVGLVWRFSKPVKMGDATPPGWVAALGQDNTVERFDQPSPDSMRLVIRARQSAIIEPGVIDASGIPVRTPIVVSLGVLGDRAPAATITGPARDEAVSAHAVIELIAELSDDFGLWRGGIDAVHAAVPAASAGAPHEGGESAVLVLKELDAAQRATLTHTLDISTLAVSPGDQVWVSAVAWDLRAGVGGDAIEDGAGMTRSGDRVLRIVADAELIEGIRRGLDPVRSALRQLDEQQATLQQMVRDGDPAAGREQRALTGRIDANKRAVEALRGSIERNTLDDETLASLLDDAHHALDEASGASQDAGEQIDRGNTEQARGAQKRVRDRLGELMSMLDRGQDSWLALRGVQQLRDELRSLREDTAALSAQTAGRALDQLSGEERGALERILERQISSADDAGEAMSTLDQRAQQLDQSDPAQAQALRRAARQGRGAQIEQKLRRAGEQIGSNQTASATQTQEEVLDELERMLEELENTVKNRDNALRRELASIIESIEGLIGAQEGEIALLGQARDEGGGGQGLDRRMIALLGNTLSVRDQALGAFPETRSIADLIKRGGDAQNGAIGALRQEPIDLDAASRFEHASLLHLRSALEEAQRQDEQAAARQARRLRQELREAYRGALKTQTDIRDESREMAGEPLDRRARAAARAMAQTQDGISASLDDLLARTEALGEAPVFALAHAQLGRLMTASSAGLGAGQIDRRVIDAQDGALVILSSLVEVLGEEGAQAQKDFDDGSSQGGGGEGGKGGKDEAVIPPIAQLRLLRTMQQLAADQTRTMAGEPGEPDAEGVRALSDLQRRLYEQGVRLIEQMNRGPGGAVQKDGAPDPDEGISPDGPMKPGRPGDEDGNEHGL